MPASLLRRILRILVIPGWVAGSLLGIPACTGAPTRAREPARPAGPPRERLEYPETLRVGQIDRYHGVEVEDPYRWLEETDSPITRRWIQAQNALTFGYLEGIPARSRIRGRLLELLDYPRQSLPVRRGGRLFFRWNSGLEDQPSLLVQEEGSNARRVLIDPRELSTDGTVALADFVPSRDGALLAYGVSDGGSDLRTWRFRDVETGRELSDVITRNKFGGLDWNADGTGVYYMRYAKEYEGDELLARDAPPEICLHTLGTPESEDAVLRAAPDEPGILQGFTLTDDAECLVVRRHRTSTRHDELDLVILTPPRFGTNVPLVAGYDAAYDFVGYDGKTAYVRTDLDAPRGRLLAIDADDPRREAWSEIVPEATATLEDATLVGGRLIASYLRDVTSEVRVLERDGSPVRVVELPGLGSAAGFEGELDDPVTYFSFTNQVRPETLYRYDVATGERALWFAPELRFDPGDYLVEQVFYESKDATRIPMFLAHRRAMRRDGQNPTYLFGYGGFNISLTPSFSAVNLAWMEMGGLVAIPNLRGGGEYGEAWHEAGTKLQKQNVFDDFIAAAEWLISHGYTSTPKLAIGGGSNGGLLVGACLTQRPDLFGAALPAVGVLDMLRYHRFTIGWAWTGDYGTSDDPDEFRALYAYSPLHNARPGTSYPATLITTADHDDRVVPGHSFKFAAALQAAQAGDAPVLIRIQTRAGHGAGKPTSVVVDESADRWAFLVRSLGME